MSLPLHSLFICVLALARLKLPLVENKKRHAVLLGIFLFSSLWVANIQFQQNCAEILLFDFFSAPVYRNVYCNCRDPEPVPNKTTDFELFQQNKEVRSIAEAMEATIRGFYVKHTPTLSISRSSSSNLACQKQSEILNRILLSTSTEITYTIEEPERLKAAVRVFNLFFVDGLDGFRYVW